jgi:hypothetical protein
MRREAEQQAGESAHRAGPGGAGHVARGAPVAPKPKENEGGILRRTRKSPKAKFVTMTKERAEKLVALKKAARASVYVVHVPVRYTTIPRPLVVHVDARESTRLETEEGET